MERYASQLNHSEIRQIEGRIRADDGVRIGSHPLSTREKWLMVIDGELRIVIYDHVLGCLITIYPKEALRTPIPWVDHRLLRKYEPLIRQAIRDEYYMVIWKTKDDYGRTTYYMIHAGEMTFLVGHHLPSDRLVPFKRKPNSFAVNSLSDHTLEDSDLVSPPAPGPQTIR